MAEEKKSKKEAPEKDKEKKPSAEKKEEKKEEAGGIKNRVRVAGVILDGSLETQRALRGIKGVGPQISKLIPQIVGVPGEEKLGNLSEQQIQQIEKNLQNLDQKLPNWMLNRQKDPESSGSRHLLGPDLDMTHREDLNLMKRTKSYRGVRHSLNLPVRGQRTRSSFRKGATIGVSRKKIQQKQAAKKQDKKR